MLAWVVIDRTYPRQFLPKSSSPRTLCLCVEFSDSFHPTSVVPTTYALPRATAAPQPLCNQSVTHSFYLDGGWIPAVALPSRQRSSRMPIPCSLSPLFSIPCALFCTFLHSPKSQPFYFQAIPHSASKDTGVGGVGTSAIRKFLQCSCKFSAVKVGNSLRCTACQSPITNHFLLEPFHLHAVAGVLESE